MARGEDTRNHPNRKVDWDSIFINSVVKPQQAQSEAHKARTQCSLCGEGIDNGPGLCKNCAGEQE